MVLTVRFQFFVSSSLSHFVTRHCRRLYSRLSSSHFSLLRYEHQTRADLSKSSIPPHFISEKDSLHLHLLRRCRSINTLKQAHALLVINGLSNDELLVVELFRICFHLDVPGHALLTIHKIRNPSLFLQNSVVRILSDYGFYEDLLILYRKFQKSGCPSDNFTYPFVIKACAALFRMQTGKEIHSAVLRNGFEHNIVIQTALVDMYAKVDQMRASRRVFDRMSERDLISWNALLSGYSMNGLDVEASEVFRQVRLAGLKPNVSTLISIIPSCMRAGLGNCKAIHCYTVKCGISSHESLVPAMISTYAGWDDLSAAVTLFDLLPEKNVVAWNAFISACTQTRKFHEAYEAFRLMRELNMKPNLITLVSVLPVCAHLVGIRYGESVHALGIKHGFEHQISISTALITMYAKLGDLDAAQFLFHGMPKKNILTWNSIISGYVQNGLCNLGLDVFHEMLLKGVDPDSVSMVNVVSACAYLRDLLLGKCAHAFALRRGFDSNLNVLNALLAVYSDCSRFCYCIKLFNTMPVRNVISWNTLISGCVQNGMTEIAISLLHQMQQEGNQFDLITMISILPIFCEAENLAQGISIHGHAVKTGYDSDVSFGNALISMYANCGDLEAGHHLFHTMPFRSVVSWNALLTGYRNHNLFKEVMTLFHQMKIENERPNSVTLLNILPLCGNQMQGKSIHAYAIRNGCLSESSLLTSLMFMYDRFENVNSCRLLFEIADRRNTVVWNAMMTVLAQGRHPEKAVICFHDMLWMEVQPDSVTILTVISTCVQFGSLDIAKCMTAFIIQNGFFTDIFVSNALIDMYARCGNISTAKEVFDWMNERDSVSWSVMINGYGMHGDGDAALSHFTQMKIAGVEPDDITFIGVLSACSHAGLVNEGRKLFRSMMEEHYIIPRIEHYSCMVDLLGRMGHLDEAYNLVKTMPFKPSASVLESLLGACRIYGNTRLGEEVGRLLFELNPENSRFYVMLSNIYGTAGRWMDASSLRYNMEGRGLRKVPGFSAIEVNS